MNRCSMRDKCEFFATASVDHGSANTVSAAGHTGKHFVTMSRGGLQTRLSYKQVLLQSNADQLASFSHARFLE